MAACARKTVFRPGQPGIYHVWNKTVRGAYLLGEDSSSGKDCSHRREWVVERLKLLVRNFAIDVAKYAVMENHVHLILRVTPGILDSMDDREIARRWLSVFPGYRIYDTNWHEPTEAEIDNLVRDKEQMAEYRRRLADLSWFMAALSEYIARRANKEDDVTGRFWQKRFECRDLADETAVLICGIYVDLNQIRSGEVFAPEDCIHSSIGERIAHLMQTETAAEGDDVEFVSDPQWLAPLTLEPDQIGDAIGSQTGLRASDKGLLPITLEQYIELVDWAGRQERPDKRGAIPEDLAPILERLGINEKELVEVTADLRTHFRRFVGTAEQIAKRAQEVGRKWFHGIGRARRLFSRNDSGEATPQVPEASEAIEAEATR